MTTIYVLNNYNWERAELVSENKTTYSVKDWYGLPRRVQKERCALPDEIVCVVWEIWRGKNGRGGYRVERHLHQEHRVPAKNIPRQGSGPGRVWERSLGEIFRPDPLNPLP